MDKRGNEQKIATCIHRQEFSRQPHVDAIMSTSTSTSKSTSTSTSTSNGGKRLKQLKKLGKEYLKKNVELLKNRFSILLYCLYTTQFNSSCLYTAVESAEERNVAVADVFPAAPGEEPLAFGEGRPITSLFFPSTCVGRPIAFVRSFIPSTGADFLAEVNKRGSSFYADIF